MSERRCVECDITFIPFVTGYTLHCSSCHSEIIAGLQTSPQEPESITIISDVRQKPVIRSNQDIDPSKDEIEERLKNYKTQYKSIEELNSHERHFHSMEFNKSINKK